MPEPHQDESVAKALTQIIRAPSGGIPVTYRSDGTFTDAELDFVHSMIVGTRCVVGDAGGVNVYLWTDRQNMFDAYVAFHSIPESEQEFSEWLITNGGNFGNKGSLWLDAKYRSSAATGYTIVHEYLHVVQHHRSRDTLAERQGTGRSLGPIWLSEGQATRTGVRIARSIPRGFAEPFDYLTNFHGTGMSVHEVAETHPLTLREIESDAGWWGPEGEREAQSYAKAYVAFERLEHLFGTTAVDVELFENMNRHVRWEDAFEATFGITAEQWYAHFDDGKPLPSFAAAG